MTRHLAALALILTAGAALPAGDWPGWRGPNGDGVSGDKNVPLRWGPGQNVTWKVEVPGVGHSSPVVTGDRVLLTAFLSKDNARVLLCYDRRDGKRLWQKTVLTAQAETRHASNTPASSTPVTDGRSVWTTFLDGDKVVTTCHDLSGKQLWQKGIGGFDSRHGFCGSPALHKGLVIINGDSDGDAFLAGLDARTGEVRWRVARPNKVRSFSAPLFIDVGKRRLMVLAGSKSVAAYDPATGKQVWVVDTQTEKFVATVAHAGGVVLATGTSPKQTLIGIDPRGAGNVTKTHVLWSGGKVAAYVPSPVGVGSSFFVVTDAGVGSLLDATTGKPAWTHRLGSKHIASPLLVNGRVYCLAADGEMFVLKAGEKCEVLARNTIGEDCHATPAVSEGQLFIRGVKHMWCIGARQSSPPGPAR